MSDAAGAKPNTETPSATNPAGDLTGAPAADAAGQEAGAQASATDSSPLTGEEKGGQAEQQPAPAPQPSPSTADAQSGATGTGEDAPAPADETVALPPDRGAD